MKTVLVVTNIILAGIILYLIFPDKTPPVDREVNCKDRLCKDYSGVTFHGISADLAKKLSENYVKDDGKKFIRKVTSVRTIERMDDATSVWFSLETLKKFIWKIEQSACEHPCDRNPVLGVRIYYAKYPDSVSMVSNTELKVVKPAFAEHHTLFMVPTFQENNDHIDFDPLYWGENNCKPLPFKDRFSGVKKDDLYSLRNNSLILSPTGIKWIDSDGDGVPDLMDPALQNHGDLAPPPRGKGVFGTY